MGKQNFGSGREDKGKVLTVVESLLHLGEPFQVIAVPSAAPRSGQDSAVIILWGDDLLTDDSVDVETTQLMADGKVIGVMPMNVQEVGEGQCAFCGSYNPAVKKQDGCTSTFHRVG